ncbi:MAG: hypothetical protein FJ303_13115 [Planctomycetes bacterium]|nr:hypothetical protein [Planctomycetota bacterium]
MRFVILEHDHPFLHWDFMLESVDRLQTWRLVRPPETIGDVIEATALGDHRIAYLTYEGPVSGNRGIVRRWDAGTFAECDDSSATCRRLVLTGLRVKGTVELLRVDGGRWTFRIVRA